MPYANVQQVQAPDFSGIGDLLRGANTSFNNAFVSANDILGKYQEGQQAKADASILNDLASVKNEEDLNKFLADNPLANRNLSPEMQKTILAMRNTALGYDTTRIGNQNAIDANARANAGENRTQTDWVYGNKQRDALNAAAPGMLGAYVGALTTGQAAPGSMAPVFGGGPTQAAQAVIDGLVARGVPLHVAVGVAMNAQSESGFNPAAIGDGGTSGGMFQLHGDRFKGLQDFAQAQGKSWQDPNVQLDYFMYENQTSEKGAWDKVMGAQNSNEAAVSFLQNWERPAVGPLAARTAAYSNAGGAIPGPNGYTGGQTNGYMANPAMLAGIDTLKGLAATGVISFDTLKGMMDTLVKAQQEGQDQILARDAATQAAAAADALRAGILNPNHTTNGGVVRSVLTNPNLRGTTALDVAGKAGVTLADPNIASVVAPPTLQDPLVQSSVDSGNANAQRLLDATDPAKAEALSTSMASDPGAALVKATQDPNADNGLTGDYVNRQASRLAAQAGDGITAADITATMKLMDDQGIFVEDMLIGSNFDQNMIVERARSLFGTSAKQDLASQKGANASDTGARSAIQLQISTMTTQLAKMAPNDPNRAVLTNQINNLKSRLVQIGTPVEAAISKILVTPPTAQGYAAQVVSAYNMIDQIPASQMSATERMQKKQDLAKVTGIPIP